MMSALKRGSRTGLARGALALRRWSSASQGPHGVDGPHDGAGGSHCCPPPDFFPLPQPVQAVLNEQIGAELAASLAYLDMAARMSTVAVSLRGAAAMFSVNAEEEWRHGRALVRWLVSRGGLYSPRAIAAPVVRALASSAWEEAHNAVAAATALERRVTESLLNVHMTASSCGDVATADFISQEMLREQVQALYVLGQASTQLQWVRDSPQGLHFWDEKLHQKFANRDD